MEFEKLVEVILKGVQEELARMESPNMNLQKVLVASRLCHQGCQSVLNQGDLPNCQVDYSVSQGHNVNLKGYNEIVVGDLDNESLTKLQMGLADSPYLKLISQGLMEGKKIYIPREEIQFLNFKDTAPKSFTRLFQQKLDTLAGWGVVIKPKADIVQLLNEKYQVQSEPISGDGKIINKKYVTQRDVEEAVLSGAKEITLTKSSKLTDIAEEYAERHNIKIYKM